MISLKEAKSIKPEDSWSDVGGEKKSLPLFNDSEIPIAEGVVDMLHGLSVHEANEVLDKCKAYLIQASIIQLY